MKRIKKKNYIVIFILTLHCCIYSQDNPKNVLFIGNSYTYSNNMPTMVSNMAASSNDVLNIGTCTIGGYTLKQHSSNTNTLNTINTGNWDYVVLQEQSQIPSFPIEYVENEVYPYAKKLDSIIKISNSCSETVFFMTWGRKYGDAYNCPNMPSVCTYEGMDNLLRERYTVMANQNESLLSPVGVVWHFLRENHPSIELYSSDESHPSIEGSYVAACCFYTLFLQKDPTNITFNSTLSAQNALTIKEAVKNIVYNHFNDWNIGLNNPTSNFDYSYLAPNQYQFTNSSSNSETYLWDFGDGSTSNEINPIHLYSNPGNYVVSLTSENCYHFNKISKTINLTLESIDTNVKPVRIYPNPCDKIIHIESQNLITKKEIYSAEGKLVEEIQSSEDTIDTSEINEGFYFLKIYDSYQNIQTIGLIVKH